MSNLEVLYNHICRIDISKIKVVFGWRENDLPEKWFSNFPLFSTIRMKNYFFQENDFSPSGGK